MWIRLHGSPAADQLMVSCADLKTCTVNICRFIKKEIYRICLKWLVDVQIHEILNWRETSSSWKYLEHTLKLKWVHWK